MSTEAIAPVMFCDYVSGDTFADNANRVAQRVHAVLGR
jgi:hypothetical protein